MCLSPELYEFVKYESEEIEDLLFPSDFLYNQYGQYVNRVFNKFMEE